MFGCDVKSWLAGLGGQKLMASTSSYSSPAATAASAAASNESFLVVKKEFLESVGSS